MIAVADEIATLKTIARVRESSAVPNTWRLRKGDWWYLKSPVSSGNESAIDKETDAAKLTLPQSKKGAATKVRPVSKDLGTVTLDGDRKVLLQQWECVVLERQDDVVCCELYDLTNESNPIEYAEVLLNEFNAWDRPLLIEGAVFYWSLGHLRKQTGQVRRFTEFQLRRMPKLSQANQQQIAQKVKSLSGLLLGK